MDRNESYTHDTNNELFFFQLSSDHPITITSTSWRQDVHDSSGVAFARWNSFLFSHCRNHSWICFVKFTSNFIAHRQHVIDGWRGLRISIEMQNLPQTWLILAAVLYILFRSAEPSQARNLMCKAASEREPISSRRRSWTCMLKTMKVFLLQFRAFFDTSTVKTTQQNS